MTGVPIAVPFDLNCTVPTAVFGATVAVRSTALPVIAVAGTYSDVVVSTSTGAGSDTVTVCAAADELTNPAPAVKSAVTLCTPATSNACDRVATPAVTVTGEPIAAPFDLNCTVPTALFGATVAVRSTALPVIAVAGTDSDVAVSTSTGAEAMLIVASGPAPALRALPFASRGVHLVGAHCVPRRLPPECRSQHHST